MNDLELIHPNCPNFKWYEVWKSSTADRLEIDNTTDDQFIIQKVRAFVLNLAQPVRNAVGPIRGNSWFRCEELEKVITRKSFLRWCEKSNREPTDGAWDEYFSRKSHPTGGCMDLEVSSMSNDDLFSLIKKDYEFDQLIREFPVAGVPDSGWVHMSWASDKGNRGQAFTIP